MKKRLSRAKRKMQKQKILKQQQRLALQPSLTQAQVDDLILKIKEEQAQEAANRKLKAKNEAFDHFVNTGEVITEPVYFDRFITLDRIGSPLPDIDLPIIDYPQVLSTSKRPVSQNTIDIFDKLIKEFNKKYGKTT